MLVVCQTLTCVSYRLTGHLPATFLSCSPRKVIKLSFQFLFFLVFAFPLPLPTLPLDLSVNEGQVKRQHHHHHYSSHKWPSVFSAGAVLWNLSSASAVQRVHLHGRQHSSSPSLALPNYEQKDKDKRRLRPRSPPNDNKGDEDDNEEKNGKEGTSLCSLSSDLVSFCGNDTENCFVSSAKCDAISDCSNGYDESIELCGCLETEIRCNSTCIDRSLIFCNTVVDCIGAVDENEKLCGKKRMCALVAFSENFVFFSHHQKRTSVRRLTSSATTIFGKYLFSLIFILSLSYLYMFFTYSIPDENVCNFVNNCGLILNV